MKIGILAYDRCLGGEVFGFADVLHFANRMALARRPGDPAPFEIRLVSAGGASVTATHGVQLSAEPSTAGLDLLAVPGFDFTDLENLEVRLAEFGAEVSLIKGLAEDVKVAGICVGGFLLGEAGLLDGRAATTAWLYTPELARRNPSTRVEPEAMIVEDGRVTTTGAFSASHDLALRVIRQGAGDGLARAVGRLALLETGRASQSAYVDVELMRHLRPPFARGVRRRLEAGLADPYDLEALATAMSVSSRTLLRRFKAETGRTPLEDLQALRVGRAKRLLEGTRLGLGEIAAQVGYQDLSTFGRLFARLAGVTPAAYRRRFRQAA